MLFLQALIRTTTNFTQSSEVAVIKLRSGRKSGPPEKVELVSLPLTQQNLRAFNDKTSTKESSSETASSESIPSSTDPELTSLLHQNGVYFNDSSVLPPYDENKILNYLQQERSTLNNPQSLDFLRRLEFSFNEETYKAHFLHSLFRYPSREVLNEYSLQMDLEWAKAAGTPVTVGDLSNPKPDYFEAFLLGAYPKEVQDTFGWCIQPSDHEVAMPTLCVEFKGPNKGQRTVIAQAAYDGAVMVDAAWEIHKYMKKPARDFFGKTQALVIAISDQTFHLFACHALPVDWNQHQDEYPAKLEYHIFNLVNSIIDSKDQVKTVCLSISNAQDWC
jgi:hypothetical protein